jgi:tetratricopeptide (TPR) repeat protein
MAAVDCGYEIEGETMSHSRFRRGLLFVVALFAIAAAPRIADADSDTAKAKQLYAQGVTAYNLGHYDEALTAFEMGYRLRQDSAFLFNIAQCQRMLNRYQDAERTYRAYLRESPALPDAKREQIQKLIAEMENAIEEQRSKQPPTGTQAPATTQPTEPASPNTRPAPADNATRADLTAHAAPAHQEKPIYKRGWFWGVAAAVVVVGVGVGLGVGLGTQSHAPKAGSEVQF